MFTLHAIELFGLAEYKFNFFYLIRPAGEGQELVCMCCANSWSSNNNNNNNNNNSDPQSCELYSVFLPLTSVTDCPCAHCSSAASFPLCCFHYVAVHLHNENVESHTVQSGRINEWGS